MRRTVGLHLRLALAWATLLIAAGPVEATQHLIRPGDSWTDLAPRLRPGDEIILMPGQHRPAVLDDLHGTAAQPITIRGLDPDYPSVIEAEREGIRLRRPRHVIIRNLRITGASINGITLNDEVDGRTPEHEESMVPFGHVVIDSVTIERTGPSGRRHAISAAGLEQITIRDCRFMGWGGAAIELVAIHNATVRDCELRGRTGFSQLAGIQVRAGSDHIVIERCHLIDAGAVAIVIGGASDVGEFRLSREEDMTPGSVFEARRVQVRQCLIHGGDTPVAFIKCIDSRFASNTIVRPRRWAYLVHDEPREPMFGSMRRCAFGSNLIVWEPGDLEAFSFAAEGVSTDGLALEQNLWWSPTLQERQASLGPLHGEGRWPQIMDVNPKLDAAFEPTAPEAVVYGMAAP